jgi:hypothetical protein
MLLFTVAKFQGFILVKLACKRIIIGVLHTGISGFTCMKNVRREAPGKKSERLPF